MIAQALPILRDTNGKPTAFPSAAMPAVVATFTYDAQRMGGAPSITASTLYPRCLDNDWTLREYVEFLGERFYVRQTPSASKANDDARFKHQVTFVSERQVLENVFFFDVVTSATPSQYADRFRSNSTTVLFYGDIAEFVARLNDSLVYSGLQDPADASGYRVVIDQGVSSATQRVSIDGKYFAEALQEVYNVFKLAYYWVGKTCHIGYTENAINTPLAYGIDGAFLSVSKDNAGFRLINQITGTGGSDNLPYYYPNLSPAGSAIFHTENFDEAAVTSINLEKAIAANPNLYNEPFVLAAGAASAKLEPQAVSSATYRASLCTAFRQTGEPEKAAQLSADPIAINGWNPSRGTNVLFKAYSWNVVYMQQGGTYTLTPPAFSPTLLFPMETGGSSPRLSTVSALSRTFISQWEYASAAEAEAAFATDWLPADIAALFPTSNGLYQPDGFDMVLPESVSDSYSHAALTTGYYVVVTEYFANIQAFNIPYYDNSRRELGGGAYFEDGLISNVLLGGSFSKLAIAASVPAPIEADLGFFFGDSGFVAYADSGITISGIAELPKAQWRISYDAYGRTSLTIDDSTKPAAAKVFITGSNWIEPSQALMPSIYRQSGGAQRFYNALNNTYTDDGGQYVTFPNPFSPDDPREGITSFTDITPTISGIKNAAGQLIGQIADIAFDSDDSDALKTNSDEYLHSFFYVKLRVFNGPNGFNLFEQASAEAAIVMTSGNCNACTFPIMVDRVQKGGEYSFRNPVTTTSDGALKPSGWATESGYLGDYIPANRTEADYVTRQQDTSTAEVWVALQKETSTFGILMPNAAQGYRPAVGDTFVITGITMPLAYITAAEERLDQALIAYMAANNAEKFTFSVKFSRIFLETNPSFTAKLNENARILVSFNGEQHSLYVSDFSCKADGNILTEAAVSLTDTLAVSMSSFYSQLDSVKAEILASLPGMRGDVLAQGLKYFLRKDTPDTANAAITFLQGLLLGTGAYGITPDGNANLAAINANEAAIATAAITEMASRTAFLQGATFAEQAAFAKGLLSGLVRSDDYVQGLSGYTLETNAQGRSRLEVDELLVRVKAVFQELEIRKLSYAGGNIELSGAGSTLVGVRPLTRDGEQQPYAWRCFLLKDDGTTRTRNWWRAGDMAKCQTFNIDGNATPTSRLLSLGGRLIAANAQGSPLGYGAERQGSTGNRYYWRLVTATGTETIEGTDYDFIELSNEKEVVLTAPDGTEVRCQGYDEVFDGFDLTDAGMKWHADANDAPQEGDEIVQEGNQLDTDRQHIIRLVTVGENAPAIQEYCGVGAHDGLGVFTLSPRLMTQLAPRTGNIFRARRFEVETESGAVTRIPVYRGQWQQGQPYYYYEQVSHQGSLWLCTSQKGTTAEPARGSSAWQLQVAKGDDGHDGTPGKDGVDGALSAVRAYFTPQTLAVNEGEGGSFDLSQAQLDVTVMRGFQEEITGSCTFSYYATGCTVEQGDYPYQCRITAITGRPERATVRCNVRVPANYAGGTPETMQCSADIAINYLGSFRETIENDVKTQIASKTFSYVDDQGKIQTIEGISRLVQSASGLTSEVWRRQPAGSVIANGAFTDGLEKWIASGEAASTTLQGIPCAVLDTDEDGMAGASLTQYADTMLCDWQAPLYDTGEGVTRCDIPARFSMRVLSPTGCTIEATLADIETDTPLYLSQAIPATSATADEPQWTTIEAQAYIAHAPTKLYIRLTSAGSASVAARCFVTDIQLIPDLPAAQGSKIEQTAESIELSVASVKQGLTDTGINIQDRLIRVNADNFIISNNQGEQTMRVDEDGQLNIRQLKVDDANRSNKARVEIGVDADGNPYLTGFNKDGQAVWTFNGDISLNFGDGILMQILAVSSAKLNKPGQSAGANFYQVAYNVQVLVTNKSNEALTYNSGAIACRADDWRTAGGNDFINIPLASSITIPAGDSKTATFSATVRYAMAGSATYDPSLDIGDTTTISAWYNKPGSGWTKLAETPLPFTKGLPIIVGP